MRYLLACGALTLALAHAAVATADTRIVVPGAAPPPLGPLLDLVGATEQDYDAKNLQVGAGWFPGTTPRVVDYPATAGLLWGPDAPSGDEAIALGQSALHGDISDALAAGDPVVVTGVSEGTLVIYREQAYLADNPDAPPRDQLSFVLYASPQGLAGLLPPGAHIPVFGYTTQPIPDSQYDTDVVVSEYDGWADPPDRPWNVVSDLNALAGAALYVHGTTAHTTRDDAVQVSRTTNAKGGTTTAYRVRTERLPLTRPLRDIGVPDDVVDVIDTPLRRVVDAGYSRNDAPTSLLDAVPRALDSLLRPTRKTAPDASRD